MPNYSREVSAYVGHKFFYNVCAVEVVNFCKAQNINCHIKAGTFTEDIMKRPIKFRGRTCGNVMVYGDLRHVGSTAVIDDTAVYEDSIAQLVGFDRDGNEVYEGDIVIEDSGAEFAARLFANITMLAKLKEARS